jgi:GGDEF domain-containing protein
MRSKRQRISIFVLFSIALGIALSAVVLITASNLIHSKQLKQIQLVEQFTYSNLGDNAKLLSKQLRAAVELEFLSITDNNGNVLYRYIQPEHNYHLITPILQSFSMYTEPTSMITSNGELYIEFHSSYDEFLRLFTGLLFFMFFAPTIILGLNSVIRVRHPVKQKVEVNDDIENEQIKDKLTGLPTGPIFIQEFELLLHSNTNSSNTEDSNNETAVKQTKKNKSKKGSAKKKYQNKVAEKNGNSKASELKQSKAEINNAGYFVLIRATELQFLNFNLGYPAGDKYIQLIGQAISTQVLKDPNVKAFKLNGLDFGLILPNYSAEQCDHLIAEISAQFTASFLELDIPSKLGFATLSYDTKTDLTQLLALADTQANN